jgi:hypothetical protein
MMLGPRSTAAVFGTTSREIEFPKQLDRIRDLLTSGGHLLTSNISHPYNPGLYRLLDERFELVDAVEVSNQTFRGRRHRKISAYRRT